MTDNISKRYFGQVKWFNTKAGYGFITVCKDDTPLANKDIFVHYSALRVLNPQYKYLVQGEYIEFSVVKPESDKYEYHASDVSGILGGNIMCETKRIMSVHTDYPRKQMDGGENKKHRQALTINTNTEK